MITKMDINHAVLVLVIKTAVTADIVDKKEEFLRGDIEKGKIYTYIYLKDKKNNLIVLSVWGQLNFDPWMRPHGDMSTPNSLKYLQCHTRYLSV